MSELLRRHAWMENIRILVEDSDAKNITIATYAAPKMWAKGSVVAGLLQLITVRRPDDVTILIGLPREDTEDFSWYLTGVFELADKWKRIDWRIRIGSHEKFVYATIGRSIFGMVGSVNFTDSMFEDLGLYVQKGLNKSFETHVRRQLLLSKKLNRFLDPRRALPNDWKSTVMVPVAPSEPTGE